ncbi:MAG: carboxypeptidase-like regulatory domain-containing protein, partial [Bacteroidota bacterium]
MKKKTTLLKTCIFWNTCVRICIGLFLLQAPLILLGQNKVLKGLVLDMATSSPMPGAELILLEKSRIEFTDVNGLFNFGLLEPNTYTIQVRYLGYKTDRLSINLADSSGQDISIYLVSDALTTEEVVISTQALGQTKAINQQLNSDAIANIVSADRIQELPDVNAAEAIARLPGIAINRSGGEGQKIVIRGLEP